MLPTGLRVKSSVPAVAPAQRPGGQRQRRQVFQCLMHCVISSVVEAAVYCYRHPHCGSRQPQYTLHQLPQEWCLCFAVLQDFCRTPAGLLLLHGVQSPSDQLNKTFVNTEEPLSAHALTISAPGPSRGTRSHSNVLCSHDCTSISMMNLWSIPALDWPFRWCDIPFVFKSKIRTSA